MSNHPITNEQSVYVRTMGLKGGTAAMLKKEHGDKIKLPNNVTATVDAMHVILLLFKGTGEAADLFHR